MDFISLINDYFDELSTQEKQIVAHLQQEELDLKRLTSQTLAEDCFVSRSTIFRLLKKLDLDSFAELKYLVQKNQRQQFSQKKIESFDKVVQAYHLYIDQVFEKLDLSEVLNVLLETDVLYLYGTGNEQKLEVETLRSLFTSVGKKVIVFFDKGEYDYVKERFKENDLLVLVSYKGESGEGIAILKDSQLRGIKRLVFTKTSQNTMARLSDYQVYVPTESIQTPTRLTYEVSTTFYFMIDQLFFDYMEKLEEKDDTRATDAEQAEFLE